MKKVLFLHSSSELYGSDRSLLNLLKNLDKQEYKLLVVLPCEGPLLKEIQKIKDIDIIINDIAVLRRKNLSLKGVFSYFIDLIKSVKFLKNVVK